MDDKPSNGNHPDNLSSNGSAKDKKNKEVKKDNNSPSGQQNKNNSLMLTICMIIAIVALAGFGWLWLQMQSLQSHTGTQQSQIEASVHSTLNQAQSGIETNLQTAITTAQKKLQSIADNYSKSNNDIQQQVQQTLKQSKQQIEQQLTKQQASIADNQKKLTNLMQTSGNQQQDWVIIESEYLLRMAQLNLLVNRDVKQALTLTYMADARLQSLNDPKLDAVRQELAKKQQALQAVPQININKLVATLDNIGSKVGALPINPNSSRLKLRKVQPTPPSGSVIKDQWNKSINELKSLFIIRKLNQPIRPLLSPDDLVYVQTNIRLKLSQAEWALLHRQQMVYKHSIQTAEKWLVTYFDRNHQQTKKILAELKKLQNIQVAPRLPDLSQTIEMVRLSHANSKATRSITDNQQAKQQTAVPSDSTQQDTNTTTDNTEQQDANKTDNNQQQDTTTDNTEQQDAKTTDVNQQQNTTTYNTEQQPMPMQLAPHHSKTPARKEQ